METAMFMFLPFINVRLATMYQTIPTVLIVHTTISTRMAT